MSRSIYVDSALHVVKGAAVSALKIATGRSTLSVANKYAPGKPHAGSITLGGVKSFDASSEGAAIQEGIDAKIGANERFHCFKVSREVAEKV